jgi:Ca2+-binding RTX toxin-like protein
MKSHRMANQKRRIRTRSKRNSPPNIEPLERRAYLSLSFAASAYPIPSEPGRPLVVDLAGDGMQDIVTANTGGTVSILIGNGDGTFQPPQSVADGLTTSAHLSAEAVAADFNGHVDLAIIDGSDQLSLLMGNGDGTFQPATVQTLLSNVIGITTADFNGDGQPDLALLYAPGAGSSVGHVAVMLGDGDGSFQAPRIYSVGVNPSDLVAADLAGDGKIDLLTANDDAQGTVTILPGNGDGTFGNPQTLSTSDDPELVDVADVNGDGKLDIITAGIRPPSAYVGPTATGAVSPGNESITVRLGNGDGTFQPAVSFYAVTAYTPHLAIADVNGDGNMDILTLDNKGNIVSLPGNGDGTFKPARDVGNISQSYTLATADLNGDGKPDIVTTSGNTVAANTQINVLLNTTNSPFITLSNGIISGAGTSANDTASVTVLDSNVVVTIDQRTRNFPLADVQQIDLFMGAGADSVTIGQTVPPTTVNGGAGPDTIVASNSVGDTLAGGNGNDSIVGGSGPDLLDGGNGADTLMAGTGNQILTGDAGNDSLTGESGDDLLKGGLGDDSLTAGTGNNTLKGGAGDDSLDGSGGGDDLLIAGTGNNVLVGAVNGVGLDTLLGGPGNDTIAHGPHDSLSGGGGNDLILS